MTFLHNIRSVSHYEAKTLRRSWFFRLFSIGALVIFTFMNIGLFSPVGDESWDMIAIPASLPLVNLYLLNIGQALIVIFLAADFLKRDKKLDTNEVLYTRSMSNFEYIIGKTLGILRLFIGLDILILCIGLLMNIISRRMSIDIAAYFYYLLILCVPTLVYSLGLAFMMMSLIRNQALTFMLLLGYAALNMFWLYYRAGSIFDYMAFGLPVFKSDIVGFDNPGFIINQRLFYFLLGLAFVMLTILLFKRLPQSRIHRSLTVSFLIIFLAGSVISGIKIWSFYRNELKDKQLVIETNRQYENKSFPAVTDASISFTHKGESFDAAAEMKIINNTKNDLGTYLFSLNPSLTVIKVASGSKELSYKRVFNILEIEAGRLLKPSQTDSLIITYSGSINESFCYPDYTGSVKENPYRIEMLNVKKRQSFLKGNYVLLTPEAHWYPVAGLNYYPSNPARLKIDFTNYSLSVRTRDNLTAVSQGILRKVNGEYVFRSESPLTGITLAIGNYLTDSLIVDSVKYLSYYYPGHDYYKKDLAELKDTLGLLVSGIMRELETNFSTPYPFKTLSLAEVPVQFYSLPKMSTQTRAELQPSMVLLPEKLSTLQNAGFDKRFSRQKKRMARTNQVITDKELQVRLFHDFIRNTFISGENFRYVNGVAYNEPTRYRLGPSFYFFRNNFYSSDYPVINAVFESHLQKVTAPGPGGGFMSMFGSLSANDKANLALREMSFKDLLAKNPAGDTIRNVLTVKGDYLFNLFRARAGIEEFKEWFSHFLDKNKFQSIDIIQMNSDIRERFGFEFYPYLNDWFNKKEQPGFLFKNLQVSEIIVGDRSRYQVTFTASNPEPVAGLFNVSFRTGGQGGPDQRGQMTMIQGGPGGGGITISMQGRGMEASDISKIIFLGPGEARKIGIVLDAQPRAMLVNTIFARNIPGEINMPIEEIIKTKGRIKEFSGEEILTSFPLFSEPGETIVDNEDPGFRASSQNTISPLKKLLGIKNRNGETYEQIRMMNVSEYWQPVVLSSYYGKYTRSSVYTRGGTGDKIITWSAVIDKPGYYDIYTYIGKTGDRMTIRREGGGAQGVPPPPEPRGNSPYKDMHYKVYHDEGVDEITVDFENAENGWNNLGRYYLTPDTVKVELTNLSTGRIVIGDAVKWVLQD